MQRIILADVETTGFSPKTEKIVEISFMEVDEGLNVLNKFESKVNPEIPIPPSSSAIHGLTDEDVKNSPTLEEVINEFELDYFNDVFLIAHNSPFDRRFLKKVWTVNGEFCTLKAARYLYPQAENHKLGTLKYWLKLDNDIGDRKDALAHSALGDVLVLFSLLKRMLEDSKRTLHQLYELVYQPQEINFMPFGKHKGLKLRSLPKQYVKWLLTLENLDQDLKTALLKL